MKLYLVLFFIFSIVTLLYRLLAMHSRKEDVSRFLIHVAAKEWLDWQKI